MEIQMTLQASQMMFEVQSRVQKQNLGAQLVGKTLDAMNKPAPQGDSIDYQSQKDVLAAAVTGRGTILDIIS